MTISLDTSKKALTDLATKGWMHYSLELPTLYFLNMVSTDAIPFDSKLIQKLSILEGFEGDFSDFSIHPLLHIESEMRIPNEINLLTYKNQPFMIYQIRNEGVQDEKILHAPLYEELALRHVANYGIFSLEDRIRIYTDSTFTATASSDHILIFTGETLHSTSTQDFPEMD